MIIFPIDQILGCGYGDQPNYHQLKLGVFPFIQVQIKFFYLEKQEHTLNLVVRHLIRQKYVKYKNMGTNVLILEIRKKSLKAIKKK